MKCATARAHRPKLPFGEWVNALWAWNLAGVTGWGSIPGDGHIFCFVSLFSFARKKGWWSNFSGNQIVCGGVAVSWTVFFVGDQGSNPEAKPIFFWTNMTTRREANESRKIRMAIRLCPDPRAHTGFFPPAISPILGSFRPFSKAWWLRPSTTCLQESSLSSTSCFPCLLNDLNQFPPIIYWFS